MNITHTRVKIFRQFPNGTYEIGNAPYNQVPANQVLDELVAVSGTYFAKAEFYSTNSSGNYVLKETKQSSNITVTKTEGIPSISFQLNYNDKTNQLNPYNICGNTPIDIQVFKGAACSDALKGTFLSVQECDAWGGPIGVEVSQWFWLNDNPNGKQLNVRNFCQSKNFALQQGKYYRVKIASGTPWVEYVRIIYIENGANAQSYPYFNLFSTPWFGSGSSSSPLPFTLPPTVYALSSNVWMHGAGTTCENKYIITVEEANQWWGNLGTYQWSRLWDGFQVPNNINIQALCELYGTNQSVTLCNGSAGATKRMIAGNLPPNQGGGPRYYRLSLATMEPGWQSVTALIRFQQNCQISGGGNPKSESIYDFPEPEPESVWSYSNWQAMNGLGSSTETVNLSTELYPNPASDMSTLRITLNAGSQLDVTVLDMQGKLVMHPFVHEYKPAGQHLVLMQADLFPASGIYFVQVRAGNETQTQKLIIQK